MKQETFRALKMALYMESIPEEQFDITHWVTRLHGVDNFPNKVRPECGTVCCFIGHLPLAFPEDFLHKTIHWVSGARIVRLEMHVTSADHMTGELEAAYFFGLPQGLMKKVIFAEHYVEDHTVSKSVVVGRFLDYVRKEHGIADMEAALESVRQRLPQEPACPVVEPIMQHQ